MAEPVHIRRANGAFVHLPAVEQADIYAVQALIQDRTGFVWAGTQHGLFRIDAAGVRHFMHDPDDPRSIPGSFVFSLAMERDGTLWVGTIDGGCARFDYRTERFHRVELHPHSGPDNLMRAVLQMPDRRIWIATNGSLTSFDPHDASVRKFHHPPVDGIVGVSDNHYSPLLQLDERHLLVGTSSGLFIFDTRCGTFEYLRFHSDDSYTRGGDTIVAMSRMGSVVYAASTHQLYRVDLSQRQLTPLTPSINIVENEEYFAITSLAAEPDRRRLWIGTTNGLLRLDQDTSTYSLFQPDDSDHRGMQGRIVTSLLIDRSGMLWIGMKEGMSLYDLRENFRLHRLRSDSDSLPATVTGITEVGDSMWFSTMQGLCEYDEQTDGSRWYSLGGDNTQMQHANDQILHLHNGKSGLWLGSTNGLFHWNPSERRVVERYMPDPDAGSPGRSTAVLGRYVQGVIETADGNVWCGCDAMGIQCLDGVAGEFRYYRWGTASNGSIPHETLLASLEDSRGRLWLGFLGGLALYDRAADTFVTFRHDPHDPQSLSNNAVLFLLEDSRNRIWVGTVGGLNRMIEFDDGSVSFVRFGTRQGLPDAFVSAIVEHGEDLWLGTEKGIVRFREIGNTIETRLYDQSDGLRVTSYTHDAVYRDRSGLMYFGGEGGVDIFDPDALRSDDIPPVVVFTDLLLFNRPVPIGRAASAAPNGFHLDGSITYLHDLPLTHRQSVVTFRYSALHFRQPERLRYAYMLAGFDRDWIDAGSKTEATYTNLDPGDYTLRVKAMNADGIWSKHPAELAIHVEPPPWRTWWAHSLYLAAGAGAIALFTRSRIAARERELQEQRRLEQARLEERESIRRQNASDFHDEAGTTLTRILFLSELARRHSDGDVELRSLLEKIDTNATQLSQGMRDFIWVLDPDKDTLLDTLQRIASFGESLFAQSDTTFTMQYDNQQLRDVTLDLNQRRQVLMICKEALHNAARHAGAGSVMVRAARDGDRLGISIEDDGCGFDASNGSTGYGLKSMRSRAENVDAVLTVSSRPGTTVMLRLACQDTV